jgi:hypothetical protein
MLSLLQTFPREKPSPSLQLCVVLQACLALASRPGWIFLFLIDHVEGELRRHHLVGGVGLDHLATLVLLMEGA